MVVSGRGKSLCCVALPHCETAGELFRYVQIERAFGNSISIEIGFASLPSVLQANPWRFAGGSYDASVGRWTQQDPKAGSVFDARSSNRYVYAKCDPVNVTDPGGRTPLGLFGSCVVGFLAGILTLGFSLVLGIATLPESLPVWFVVLATGVVGCAVAQFVYTASQFFQ